MIISPREFTVKRRQMRSLDMLILAMSPYVHWLVHVMLEPMDGWDVERAGMANLQFIW